ncbi:hypothetical protein Y032_0623g765 [Ancylostoma ceylanicum]|uniref:FZ domain-containing protein n=1 Tax=Ancylostoma ceylanicum TaxID=53326 RepID=A0A016WMI2_9BILA|nr:hypothetical protein Y032_0623g765 [Ancylostoma ceylanicum]
MKTSPFLYLYKEHAGMLSCPHSAMMFYACLLLMVSCVNSTLPQHSDLVHYQFVSSRENYGVSQVFHLNSMANVTEAPEENEKLQNCAESVPYPCREEIRTPLVHYLLGAFAKLNLSFPVG